MNISELTVPGFVGPLLVGVKIPKSHIVNDSVVNKRIPVDADLHVELGRFVTVYNLRLIWNVVLFNHV